MGGPVSLLDILVNLLVGLFLLFGGLWGYSLGQGMRPDDDRDIRRSHDLIESIIFASAFLLLASVAFRGLDIGTSIGPWGLICSIFLGLFFLLYVMRE